MELSERKQKILAAVVDLYVATGEPVGSKALCDTLEFTVSSATVRNEMSDLAEMGLLEQPHTSAGRVPSHKGYRVYIDTLMKKHPVSGEEQRYIDSLLLPSAYDPEKLLDGVARALAGMTRFAAVSTTPSGSSADIRAIQFVQTSRRTAMAIMMTSAGTMKSRVFHCDFDITPEILRVFFRVLNEKLVGLPVSTITPAYIQSLAASLGNMTMLMSDALMAVLDVAQDSMQAEICLDGEMNLLFCNELGQTGIRRIMDFLSRPQELSRLLMQQSNGMKVLIGQESKRPELSESSVIVSRYSVGGRDAGAIAIIGPTRMNYGKIISNIEYLSGSVGRMLTELLDME
ncbi:heat-inducible transcriptional repressor HrcA [Caproiciproducens sp.]|uniref:heat-inducible transcriptional repressor HrcA n=1 Tax=Caproiciproducens sp. TaxID=1954376 RepID=UPI00289B9112|nr:heat-inducible transcriptional repressor HrcA [Caproiciproducens sp.]